MCKNKTIPTISTPPAKSIVHNAQHLRIIDPIDGIPLFEYCEIDHAIDPMPNRKCKDFIEIIYFHKGIQIFCVDNKELVLNGGRVLILPSGTEYSTANHPQYKSTYHRLQISDSAETFLGLNAANSNRLYQYLTSLTDIHYHGNERLANLISNAFDHLSAITLSEKNQGYGEMICFFSSLQNLLESKLPQRAPDIDIVYQYINDHITEEISLQELADLSGYSLSYFKERFISQTGVTPMYYINWRKIAFAKRMISLNYTVTEVSSMLNFTTPAYFSTVFKNYTGRTPMQYKQLIEIELKKQHHITPFLSMKKEDL